MIALSPKASPRRIASLLYARVVQAAREPALYRDLDVADTIEGRYEMIALHMALLVMRLQREGRPRARLAQALLDYMAADLDRSIRELGVGDLGVARHMKRLGEGFYGRATAYSEALGTRDDTALSQVLLRNAYAGTNPGKRILATFSAYVRRQARRLAEQNAESIASGTVAFDPVEGGLSLTTSETNLEFSRPIPVDRLGSVEFVEAIEADSAERLRLAERFGLVSLDRLDASVRLQRRDDSIVRVAGQLVADVVQTCVVTLESFPSHIEDSFTIDYSDEPTEPVQDLSLNAEHDMPEPIEGGIIDVGELVAQYLSLALDPHPRAPGAALDPRWTDSDVKEPSPFAVLEKLKHKN